MSKSEFNKTLKTCSTNSRLDIEKVEALPSETKKKMAEFIVSQRGPLLLQFAKVCDRAWLAACGYLYLSIGQNGYSFVHLGGQVIK